MRDVRPAIEAWLAAGEAVALATVIRTWGSAPRAPGAKLAISAGGGLAGSVSGGCVEAAVVEAAQAVLGTGIPRRLSFGVPDATAWSVGLACGGEIAVWVERLDPAAFAAATGALDRGSGVTAATVVAVSDAGTTPDLLGSKVVVAGEGDVPEVVWSSGAAAEVMRAAWPAILAAHRAGQSVEIALPGTGDRSDPAPGAPGTAHLLEAATAMLFADVDAPPPLLVIVGAVQIAQALAAMARLVGHRTVVVDPRAAFATRARFPDADDVVVDWPATALARLPLSPAAAVAVLSHDPKIDDAAVAAALASPAGYVGALGSRRTQAARRDRLRAAGIDAAQLDRLRGPIGLDIGARTPEEIALAVLAEITTVRRGGGRAGAVAWPGAAGAAPG